MPLTSEPVIDGIRNFRGLAGTPVAGGRRVRPGVLYRSAALVGLSPKAAEQVASLGIRCVCDLRSPGEQARHPLDWPGSRRPRFLVGDVLPDARVAGADLIHDLLADASGGAVQRLLTANARDMPGAFGDTLRRLFDVIIDDEEIPVLVGCTAGKDRTGFVTAIVLLALGASRDTVVADFVRSRDYLDSDWLYDSLAAWVPNSSDRTLSAERLFEVSFLPEYLHASLNSIEDRHGTLDLFLEQSCGLVPARRRRLVELLTEPDISEEKIPSED